MTPGMEAASGCPKKTEDEWNKIFEVLKPPPRERIQFIRPGYEIQAGDFGWASPRSPGNNDGTVHLTGYDVRLVTIWHADLELSEVRYVGPKPTVFPDGKNPFPVKRPKFSVVLLIDHMTRPFILRWHWWQKRHFRRQMRLRHEQATKEK